MNFNKFKKSFLSIFFKILFLFYSINAFSSENLDYYDLYQKGDYNAAFRSAYKVSITSDDPKAKYVIGNILLNGLGDAKQNKNRGYKLLSDASNYNFGPASLSIAKYLKDTDRCGQAISFYQKAKGQGEKNLEQTIADLSFECSENKLTEKQCKVYEDSFKKGDNKYAKYLGQCFENGLSGNKQISEAHDLYRIAYEKDDGEAGVLLAKSLIKDNQTLEGMKLLHEISNSEKFDDSLVKSANKEFDKITINMNLCSKSIEKKDRVLIEITCLKLAEQGSIEAKRSMYEILLKGLYGFEKSTQIALNFLNSIIKSGDSSFLFEHLQNLFDQKEYNNRLNEIKTALENRKFTEETKNKLSKLLIDEIEFLSEKVDSALSFFDEENLIFLGELAIENKDIFTNLNSKLFDLFYDLSKNSSVSKKIQQRFNEFAQNFIDSDDEIRELLIKDRKTAIQIVNDKIKSGDCSYAELAVNSLLNENPFEYDEAIEIGEACYSKDNNNLSNHLGHAFFAKSDFNNAYKYHNTACERNMFLSCEELGYMFLYKKIPTVYNDWREKDLNKLIVNNFEKCSNAGIVGCHVMYARLLQSSEYISELEMPKDKKDNLAEQLYEKAIRANSVDAMYDYSIWRLPTFKATFNRNYRTKLCNYLSTAMNEDPTHSRYSEGQKVKLKRCKK